MYIETVPNRSPPPAIPRMMETLGLDTVIASKRCRERDLILAMIVERLIHPRSKLSNTRHWNDTTLPYWRTWPVERETSAGCLHNRLERS